MLSILRKVSELIHTQIKEKRNSCRKEKLSEELVYFKELPIRKWNAPTILSSTC